MIELREVSKRFPSMGRPAIDEVTFSVDAGQTFVLLGSSGCGKSTTLKLVNRLLEPDMGTIRVRGVPTDELSPIGLRRSIGYVIQSVGLFPHWTVGENVTSLLRLAGVGSRRRGIRAAELLELVGLEPREFLRRYPDELSGGQQQRVGVARALAMRPDILLMDEPFGALDGVTRESLQDETLRLKQDLGATILMVTHDLFEALKLGDRIGVMHDGRLEQVGDAAELIRNPATPFVRELFEKPARQLELFHSTRDSA